MEGRLRLGGDVRRALAARLEARRAEIEQATLTRVHAVPGVARSVGPEYADGLRMAVSAAVDFGLGAIAQGDGSTSEIPPRLLVQARLAARHGVGLATVLRRYSAGYTLLGQFLAEEAEREGIARGGLAHLLEVQAMLFDRIVEAVTEEYSRERGRPASVERRRAELVKNLIDGAFVDTSSFAYDFDGHHVAVVASGADAIDAVDALSRTLDGRRMTAAPGDGILWAWIGRSTPLLLDDLERRCSFEGSTSVSIGEVGHGLAGWRHTHQQARAAFVIAGRAPGRLMRYREVALIASVAQDDLLARSLPEMYLAPLVGERDDGEALRDTLRAYLETARNISSTAALLGVSRRTVANRLRAVEERIRQPLGSALTEIDVALRLADLDPHRSQVR